MLSSSLSAGSLRVVGWRCAACSHRWDASVKDRAAGNGCPGAPLIAAMLQRFLLTALQLQNWSQPSEQPTLMAMWPLARLRISCAQTAMGVEGAKITSVRSPACNQQWPCVLVCALHAWLWLHHHLKRAHAGHPTLQAAMPSLAAQLHPALNGPHTAASFTLGSSRKPWWVCRKGVCGHEHVWRASVQKRVGGSGCPVCSKRRPCDQGCGSIADLHSSIVDADWDTERNGSLTPAELLPGSSVPVYWRCKKHDPPFRWQAAPRNRFRFRWSSCCPQCARPKQGKFKEPQTG